MTIPVWNRTIVNDMGDIQPGSEVEVIIESTGLPATLYSNRAGTTALTNPFFADGNGFAQFYAAPNEYRITATATSGSVVWRYEQLGGTAATHDVTTSSADTTANRVTKNGDHGIGSRFAALAVDLDTLSGSGIYVVASGTLNVPSGVINGTVWHGHWASTVAKSQILVDLSQNNMWFRSNNGATWSPWQELYHSGNMQIDVSNGLGVVKRMKNNSGAGVADQGTVAGSSIASIRVDSAGNVDGEVAATGTWKNVTGTSVSNTMIGDFVRTV